MFLLKVDSLTSLHGITTQKATAGLVIVEIFIPREAIIFSDVVSRNLVHCHRI
jgi:phage terminase large subunit-like protein